MRSFEIEEIMRGIGMIPSSDEISAGGKNRDGTTQVFRARQRLGRCLSMSVSVVSGLVLVLLLAPSARGASESPSPEFIRGYATAVLERAESQRDFSIDFREGVLRVDFESKPDIALDTILRALLEIDGVSEAELFIDGELAAKSSASEEKIAATADTGREATDEEDSSEEGAGLAGVSRDDADSWDIFPVGELMKPLVADPRWPHFSVSHLWYLSDDELERVGSATFGESFSFVRSPQYDWGEWEIGMQAMVDALFDLSRESFDLSNEDYMVGLSGSVLTHGMTTQLRLYHVSSHLGDEYLIESGVSRDSVSFEVVDLLVSYVPVDWARVYGGVGFLVNRTPSYDRFTTQFGLELTSLRTLASGLITPIFATDLQLRQENDWIPEVSVLAGLRLARPDDHTRRIEFYARYYHGRSPDGQFFDQTIDSLGVGIQLGF
jgi:hypothetical protein